MAAKINDKPTYFCVLCVADGKRNVSHVLRECRSYTSPADKVARLNYYNFCSCCSFKNHSRENCKFKFSTTCRKCNGYHLTYLCHKEADILNSKISVVYFNSTIKDDSILLPSFTVNVVQDDKTVSFRALSDTGCQRNFIKESVVAKMKLSVIEW